MKHLGVGATGTKHHVRWTAPDVVFVHQLAKVTGNAAYATRAVLEWNNIKTIYPTAADLDARFRLTNRPSTWDIAFFMEAAYLSGDFSWANEAAAILADTGDTFYFNPDSGWYALNVAANIRALIGCGYVSTYQAEIIWLINELIGLCGPEGIDGYIQDTAYAILAFKSVGGPANGYANRLGNWLALQQNPGSGWFEGGLEYPEIDGEAVRALASTIGQNVTLKAKLGLKPASSWRKTLGDVGRPFNED